MDFDDMQQPEQPADDYHALEDEELVPKFQQLVGRLGDVLRASNFRQGKSVWCTGVIKSKTFQSLLRGERDSVPKRADLEYILRRLTSKIQHIESGNDPDSFRKHFPRKGKRRSTFHYPATGTPSHSAGAADGLPIHPRVANLVLSVRMAPEREHIRQLMRDGLSRLRQVVRSQSGFSLRHAECVGIMGKGGWSQMLRSGTPPTRSATHVRFYLSQLEHKIDHVLAGKDPNLFRYDTDPKWPAAKDKRVDAVLPPSARGSSDDSALQAARVLYAAHGSAALAEFARGKMGMSSVLVRTLCSLYPLLVPDVPDVPDVPVADAVSSTPAHLHIDERAVLRAVREMGLVMKGDEL